MAIELVSPHLSLQEALHSDAAARAGIKNTPTKQEKANIVWWANHAFEPARTAAGTILIASSVFRSDPVNALVGGSESSDHRKGFAGDLKSPTLTALELCKRTIAYFKAHGIPFDQIIYEYGPSGWMHLGARSPESGLPNRGQILTKKAGTGYVPGIV